MHAGTNITIFRTARLSYKGVLDKNATKHLSYSMRYNTDFVVVGVVVVVVVVVEKDQPASNKSAFHVNYFLKIKN